MRTRLTAIAWLLLASVCARADFTFAHITDIHVTGDPKTYQSLDLRGADWPAITARWSKARQDIIDSVNRAKPDFVVVTGDLTETGLGFEYTSLLEWMDKIEAPVYMVPGNHDVIWHGKAPDPAVTRGRSILGYERVFGRSWSSFRHANTCFIMLNSTPALADAPAEYKENAALQAEWLQREMGYTERAGYPFVFVLTHHPLQMTPGLTESLSRCRVSAVLYGHIHRYTAGRHLGVLQISGTSVKGGEAKEIRQPSYGLVRVSGDKATYQLYGTSGQPLAAPVAIQRANTDQSTLWNIRQRLFPALPAPTHRRTLSAPF